MTVIVYPASTNDDGTLTTGTILNEAFFDAIESGINTLVHSSANPTVTPVNIIDEVVTARGSLANLDARLDVEHNNDGTHNLSASIVTTSVLAGSLMGINLCANAAMQMWPDGDALAPTYWDLSGAGAAIARTGTGLADTTRKYGAYAAKVTYGSATARLQQTLLDAGVWAACDFIEGEKIGYSAWVYSSTASQVRAYVYSGATAGYEYSSYHTGVAGWERLEVVETVLTTATELNVGVEISGTGNFVVSGPTAVLGDTAPDRYIPSRIQRGAIVWPLTGTPTTGDGKFFYIPGRAMNITDVQIYSKTTGTGSFTIDVEIGDGTVWASIFATLPSVLVNKEFAWKTADTATYANTFVKPAFLDNADNGAAGADQSIVRLNIDAVNAHADLVVIVRGWQYLRPFEDHLAYND